MTFDPAGYEELPAADWPWPVFRRGTSGAPVIVIHELMGLTAPVVMFADRLVTAGFTVYLPVLAGPPCATGFGKVRAATRICVSREIHLFKTGATSPVVDPLRALAAYAAEQAGTKAGVVGMCFSGGFALALAADEPVAAGVAAQPSLPIATPVTRHAKCDLGLGPADVVRLQHRLANGDTGVYVTRFSGDRKSPRERQETVEVLLGADVDVLDTRGGFPPKAHSVLAHDREGLGRDAVARLEQTYERVVAFLHNRLDG